MAKDSHPTIYLKEYQPPAFLIDTVDLYFNLNDNGTRVRARIEFRRNPDGPADPDLQLHGVGLELLSIALNGQALESSQYATDDEQMVVRQVPDAFTLTIENRIHPESNTSLEGLYMSAGNYCTQCEAEGFRKITWFLDRPDVMARYTTTIEADRERYPVMLSNGNLVDQGEAGEGRHWMRWEDPFRKPSYLFAMVAGNLLGIEDSYRTRSGRDVTLKIFVEAENIDKCDYAMASLKRAMQWDEEAFGLEYDLDIYMIVATNDFNMGAMENKGLNVFNSKYVLASAETATDSDYEGIESVIGHEYFHNWTGNRVTCRDWFQLSLKEGLTVFRDQEFSSDMNSRPVKRISEVNVLRSTQFQEDAGPMAHPVRPDSYEEISNFYTTTVYNKGAEVVRMYHTLLGADGFRRGMDLYFKRHDGQAVTTDDFLLAMQDANDFDLGLFRRWYSQAGTPRVKASSRWDDQARVLELTLDQSCPPSPGQDHKEPFHIPVATGLLDAQGTDLPLQLEGETGVPAAGTRVLELKERTRTFRFIGLEEQPLPSLLRDFSAPVRLDYPYSNDQLAFLLAHDSDPFNRWDAGQQLALRVILSRAKGDDDDSSRELIDALKRVLQSAADDPAFFALALTLPGESYIGEQMDTIDVDGIHNARRSLKREIATRLRDAFLQTYTGNHSDQPYRPDPTAMGQRQLRNLCLAYLMELETDEVYTLCQHQFATATNMTDSLGALAPLADSENPNRDAALQDFYERWSGEPLVVDKWLALQATSRRPGTLARVEALLDHPAFLLTNPNKVRALIGAFSHRNPVHFHQADGAGYRFLSDQVLKLDRLNPQVAARLAGALSRWRRYDAGRQALMQSELERLLGSGSNLSRDVHEIVSKSLA